MTRRVGGNRIAKEITKRFRKAARLVETNVTDVMKELEMQRAGNTEPGGTARSPSSAAERTPELEALEAELAQKH